MYHYFMQKNAMAHTANFLMDTLEAVASYISTFESLRLLFVGCTETYSLCEQCTFIARKGREYSKENLPIYEHEKVFSECARPAYKLDISPQDP